MTEKTETLEENTTKNEATLQPDDPADRSAAIRAQAAKNRAEMLKAEISGTSIDDDDNPQGDSNQPADGDGDPPNDRLDSNNDEVIIDSDDDLVTVKINGETRQVPREKVEKAGGVDAYQKKVAADERLKLAAQKARELEEKERELAEREQRIIAMQQQQNGSPPDQGGDQPTDPPVQGDHREKMLELIKAKNDAFLDGDDDKVAEIELQIIDLQRQIAAPPQIDTREVVETAKAEIKQEQYKDAVVSAFNRFMSEHDELKEDARLFDSVDRETERVMAEEPGIDPYTAMTKAYANVKEWMGATNGNTDLFEQRREEKRKTTSVTTSTGRSPAEPEKPKPTRSSYVEELKRRRGQIVN